MAWVYVLLAGLLETGWAIGLKYTEGWTQLWPSIATAVMMIASFWLLSKGIQTLPVGTAYAVWTGIGAAGAVIVGMLALGEPATAGRIVCVVLILAGVVGLRLVSEH